MKTTSKLIGSVLALIIVILAIFLVTKFNSHESARVATVKSSGNFLRNGLTFTLYSTDFSRKEY